MRHLLFSKFLALAVMLLLAACAVEQTGPPPAEPAAMRSQISTPLSSVAATSAGSAEPLTRGASPARQSETIDEYYPADGRVVKFSGPGAGAVATGDIELAFERTDVTEVVRVVIGDLLGAPYVIDPAVQGTVTLTTSRPIAQSGLIPALDASLKALNATISKSQGVYRISPLSDDPLAGAAVGVNLPASAGAGFEVFPLSFIGAEDMARLVRPLLPEGRPLVVDETRNLIVVGGTAAERETVRNTVDIFDVNQMAGQSVLLTGLENVDVETITFELENILGDTIKGPLGGAVRFVPIERLNAIMVIARDKAFLQEARNWIARLDRTRQADERQMFVYYMQHGRAQDMVRTLRDIFGEGGDGAAGAALRGAATLDIVDGEEDGRPVPSIATTPAPRITADQSRNALLVYGTGKQYAAIEEVLARLDITPLQVMIEAQIIEVTLTDILRYGVQYALDTGGLDITEDGTTLLTRGIDPTGITPNLGAGTTNTGGFVFTLTGSAGEARAIVDALSDLTNVNMISAPNIFVLDNQVARLSVGDEVPIITQTAQGFEDTSRTVNTIQYRDTGVLLEVTPRVNAGGMVTIEIVQEVSAAVNTRAAGTSDINSPTIQSRSILSTIAVQDGETVLLGGLIREEDTQGRSGIPVLHTIPVLGNLFGSTARNTMRTELMVLITPRVVRNLVESRDVSEGLGQKFQGVLRLKNSGVRAPRNQFEDY